MKHLHCTTCGKEKVTYSAQTKALCGSCASKVRSLPADYCYKMSIACGGTGELNGPRQGHDRWANAIKKRDGECVHCHSKEKLEAHHLLRRSKFPQFATELWNGLTLCSPCHKITHSKVGIT